MDKQTLLLINCYRNSSGKFIDDAIKCGIQPIILTTKEFKGFRHYNYKPNAKIIKEQPTYQETLKLVRSFHPIAIFSGDEEEIELVMRLQKDLKIKFANDYRYLKEQTCKDQMHLALKKAGIRYIRGEVAHSANEAVKIFKKLKARKVIVKAPRAVGCKSLVYCSNEKEIYQAANDFFKNGSKLTLNHSDKELLVQECIIGTEYFINTASCNGHHKILQIWKDKAATISNRCIFINSETLDKIDANILKMVDYMKKVLDAIHIKNGPVHSELMIDEKGPVLIEVNCRISGGALNTKFSDAIFGHHDTDEVLNALLFPKEFIKNSHKMPTVHKKAYVEIINSPRQAYVKSRPIFSIIKRLESFYDTTITIKNTKELDEPISFVSNCGIVHLLHHNPNVARSDSYFLEDINKRFFGLLFEDKNHQKEDIPPRTTKGATLDQEIPNIIVNGLTLILNDDKNVPMKGAAYATITDLKNINNELKDYAYGVINLKETYDHILREELVEKFLTFMEKISVGGQIFISERTANIFPYGYDGLKVLLKLTGFKVISKKNDKFLQAIKNK
ncbi:MAG: ATP-grasp domain-containing protein [Bacilli bacterium]|nr:ATP-grasp domain-containing protein [Bacilli bacterium]